ncbi:MAG: LCP family protein [Candidatus Promineifilaceae bacterium]
MRSPSSNRRSRSGIRLPLWGLGLLVLSVLIFLVVSSFWLFDRVQALASEWEVAGPEFNGVSEPVAASESPGEENPSSSPTIHDDPVISSDVFKPWSGRDRVTILILGIDQRCDEIGPTRTDTMMLLTMDPVGLTASILSLPRDLWVEIPGFGVDRINRAYFLGEVYEYPGGGPALAVETVEATLGIKVDYYGAVNFDAFVEGVDQIGGIDVEVTETIDDPDYPDNCYGIDPFHIEPGTHHLDGQEALKYARTRATIGSDVDRATRQQQVVMAVRDKILRLDMVPQLLTRSPELWRIFQDNVRTDLTLNEAIQLGLLVQSIPSGSIRTEVIDYDYVYSATTPDGQQVLVPIRENIRELRDELFAPPAIPTPTIEDLPEGMQGESARIGILNGTHVFGLAAETQTYLEEYDFEIVEIGNADSADYRTTQVIDFGSHPNTTSYLVRLMGIPPLNISNGSEPEGDYDVLLILGDDWRVPGMAEPTPTPTTAP